MEALAVVLEATEELTAGSTAAALTSIEPKAAAMKVTVSFMLILVGLF